MTTSTASGRTVGRPRARHQAAGRTGKALRMLLATAASGVLLVGLGVTASAEPDTPVRYPTGASATRADRLAFDTCTAPSLDALRAWKSASPYRAVNIYFGGNNRGCTQPNLTASWVRQATAQGWRLLPTYFGYQPSCMYGNKPNRYTASNATARGTSDAKDAVARAKDLGLLPGSALYADVEHYNRADTSCRTSVRRYVSAWTKTLHEAGYLAGVYVHQDSGLRDLSASYDSTTYARPDAVWMARWDGNRSLTGWPTSPNNHWAIWQRAKQYRGDHDETWGGVTINIDSDVIKAPVATVARRYTVTSGTPLNARTGPATSYALVRTYQPGSTLSVVCQTTGQQVGSTKVWNRLSTGAWVTDRYVSTPSTTGFTSGLPRCMYPGQVTANVALNARTGPGSSYPTKGNPLPRGSLAYVMCQAPGNKVGTTSVWNKLRDGRWVSDYYVSSRSNTSWSTPVPRCP
ncbi:glycoside hydrolase domain-containing protein [Phytoactinopolyspora limicola]|uniref:glycoside hydrolase domain-containing protein n=1 Tax=Phytoactinopolyspora limicola TaxID=2715536 RepID=UPI00140B0724|nr:glycoside hydrolase domain-containing protein [Phytoactinopolyspora limicola]